MAAVERALNYPTAILGISAVGQDDDPDIAAIGALTGTGILCRIGADTWALRTLSAPAEGLTISNPGGVAGNPGFALANDLAALEGLAGTGFSTRIAADTWAQRTINATSPITVVQSDGVLGNPTLGLDHSAVNHNLLANLTVGDVHTHYALLAGRAGGQVQKGGTASGDHYEVHANTAALAEGNTGRIRMRERITFPDNWTFSAGSPVHALIAAAPVVTSSVALGALKGFDYTPILQYSVSQAFTQMPAFSAAPTYRAMAASLSDLLTVFTGFFASPRWEQNAGSGNCTTETLIGYFSELTTSRTGTGTGTINRAAHLYCGPGAANAIGAGMTVTILSAFYLKDPAKNASATITTLVGLDLEALTAGTTNLSLRSLGTAAEMRHAGPVMIGINAAPTTTAGNLLELERTHTLAGNIGDGFAGGVVSDPGYTGAFTVTRHNYWDVQDVSLAGGAAVTDACVLRFDAAVGTHKALAAVGTVAPPAVGNLPAAAAGTFAGWLKINVNGAVKWLPIYQ